MAYIPPEFRGEFKLPSGISKSAAAKAKKTANSRLAVQKRAQKALAAARKTARYLKKRGTTKARKRAAARVKTLQKKVTTAQKARASALNTYYEKSGQFDKLLKGNNRDAYLALKSMFTEYGLGSLSDNIFGYLKEGYGADTIALLLQDTKEYKTRFAGNEMRRKAGLPVLAPAEYLATESAYRQILADAGMPKGFYDNPKDFANWIGGDVSPTEIKSRVDAAVRMSAQANPNTKRALKELYGVSQSEVAAYFLDRDKAVPLLEKQARAAEFAQEALKRNLLDIDRLRLEYFVTAGLSMEQVRGGYAQIAETLPALQAIAGRFGTSFTQHEAEWDVIEPATTGHSAGTNFPKLGGENPTVKRKRLASQERGLFAGGRGASSAGLASGYGQT